MRLGLATETLTPYQSAVKFILRANTKGVFMIIQSRLKELFIYKNGQLINKTSRCSRSQKGDLAGHYGKTGYCKASVDKKLYYLHRLIFLYHHGHLPEYLDHIDGNPANNLIENLRCCTLSQNQHNRKISKTNKSGIKGVFWNKKSHKWTSQIWSFGKNVYLGSFDNKSKAEMAVRSWRTAHHKEFTNHGSKTTICKIVTGDTNE